MSSYCVNYVESYSTWISQMKLESMCKLWCLGAMGQKGYLSFLYNSTLCIKGTSRNRALSLVSMVSDIKGFHCRYMYIVFSLS